MAAQMEVLAAGIVALCRSGDVSPAEAVAIQHRLARVCLPDLFRANTVLFDMQRMEPTIRKSLLRTSKKVTA